MINNLNKNFESFKLIFVRLFLFTIIHFYFIFSGQIYYDSTKVKIYGSENITYCTTEKSEKNINSIIYITDKVKVSNASICRKTKKKNFKTSIQERIILKRSISQKDINKKPVSYKYTKTIKEHRLKDVSSSLSRAMLNTYQYLQKAAIIKEKNFLQLISSTLSQDHHLAALYYYVFSWNINSSFIRPPPLLSP